MARKESVSPKPVLLGLLSLAPAHPYELHTVFETELGQVWKLGKSHLYAYLKQIDSEGCATVVQHTQQDRPDKNTYYITPKGQEVFEQWLHTPSTKARNLRLELLSKMYFFICCDMPGMQECLAAQKEPLLALLESVEKQPKEKKSAAENPDQGEKKPSLTTQAHKQAYWDIVCDFRKNEIQGLIDWIDNILALDLS